MTWMRTLAVSIAIVGSASVLIGCNRTKSTPSMPTTPVGGPLAEANTDTGPHAAGKRVFAANCARCHSTGGGPMGGGPMGFAPGGPGPMGGGPMGPGGFGPGGPGGPMMGMRGPDLAKVGQAAEHTVTWFMELIRDPRSKKENARMPPFGGKISDADLKSVADYLTSLK